MELQKIIPFGTAGALLLFVTYHMILYIGRREKLLLRYYIYLCGSFTAVSAGILVSGMQTKSGHWMYLLSNTSFFISYSLYFWFANVAYGITRQSNRNNWRLSMLVQGLIYGYIITAELTDLFWYRYHPAEQIASTVCGIGMVSIGTYLSIFYFRLTGTAFTRLLLTGSLSMSFINCIYVVTVGVLKKASFGDAFYILCIAYFLETLFYSLALANKMSKDLREKINAMQALSDLQQIMIRSESEKQELLIKNKQDERRLIAREMHDQLSNSIIGLKYYVNDMRLKQADAQKASLLGNIEDEIEGVYLQAREYMHHLHQAAGKHNYDLIGFLKNIADRFAEGTLPVTLEADYQQLESQLDDHRKNILYFILKEALTNTMKHAGATAIHITLRSDNREFNGSVSDNGIGIGSGALPGIGIKSMQENIELLNGSFQVSSFQSGTSILFSFPLEQ
jgi:signal transduction histidine kinase